MYRKKIGKKFTKTLTFFHHSGRIIGDFFSFFFFLLSKEILKEILRLDLFEFKYQCTQLCDSGQIIEPQFTFIR